ncbi:MAG: hypothetical protein EBS72_15410, partial [Rhizobiales bacterium]|nr:hypothetical protein [Hyphomicrobiales bacterium]
MTNRQILRGIDKVNLCGLRPIMRKGLLQLWFLVLACGMSILLPNPSQARNGPIQTDVELVFAV